jgi:hypothetical protein
MQLACMEDGLNIEAPRTLPGLNVLSHGRGINSPCSSLVLAAGSSQRDPLAQVTRTPARSRPEHADRSCKISDERQMSLTFRQHKVSLQDTTHKVLQVRGKFAFVTGTA